MRSAAPISAERLARLRLARTERVGPVTFHEMLGHFGSARGALAALPDLARKARLPRPPRSPGEDDARSEIEALRRLGGRHVIVGDPDYPPLLAELPDAPPALCAIGDVALLSRPAVSIVGARNASANGRRIAADFARDLGTRGLVVVSGLARGIDTAAHAASVETGAVAVLAGGADVVYPPENRALYDDIAARGCVVSEVPLGTVPQARHFPRRNRIISGLSLGVVVVEAALQSGSLITALRAIDQNREVFAVPGSPLDPRSRGSNKLIRDGATLTETVDDIVAQLVLGAGSEIDRNNKSSKRTEHNVRLVSPLGSCHADLVRDSGGASQAFDSESSLVQDGSEQAVLDCLGAGPTAVDEIVRQCQVSAASVQAVLLELELAGRLERHRGNAVSLI